MENEKDEQLKNVSPQGYHVVINIKIVKLKWMCGKLQWS